MKSIKWARLLGTPFHKIFIQIVKFPPISLPLSQASTRWANAPGRDSATSCTSSRSRGTSAESCTAAAPARAADPAEDTTDRTAAEAAAAAGAGEEEVR